MPTLSNDVQAVLVTDKVRFQGQEVAFVVAEDRYTARDALELIDVEYENLPPVIDVRKALDPDAPVIRDDLEGKTDNHCFDWETGDEAATEAVFARADVVVTRGHRLPARAPGADGDVRRGGRLRRHRRQAHAVHDDAGAARAPHAVRDRRRPARAQDPHPGRRHRRRLRQQGADLPRLRLRDRRLAAHRQAGQVGRGPLGEPDQHRLRPRLRHARRDRGDQGRQDPRHPHQRARRPRRVQRHGRAGEVPGRLLRRVHRQLRHRGRVLQDDRGLHEQGARRRRLRLLVPHHRGRLPRRADRRVPGLRAEDGPGRAADQELHPARPVPVHDEDGLGLRLRQLRADDARGDAHRRLRRAAPRAGREARARRAHGHRRRVLHRGRRRRARARTWTSSASAWPTAPSCASTRPARPSCGCRARRRARATRRRSRRSSPRRSASRRPTSRSCTATPTRRRSGSGTYGSRSTPVSGAAAALVARKVRDKAPHHRLRHARGVGRRPRVGEGLVPRRGRPVEVGDDPGHRDEGARRGRSARGRRGRSRGADLLQPRRTSPTRTAPTSASSTSTRARRR